MSEEKPVKITLEDDVIHRADTIQEAEEFLVESATIDPDRREDYKIDAPAEAWEAWQKVSLEPEETETPQDVALNDFDAMRSAIVNLLSAIDSSNSTSETLDEAAEKARALIDEIVASEDFPELRQYDEIVTQGRESLLARLGGLTPPESLIPPIRFKDDHEHFNVPAPMSLLDAYRWLRRRADELVHAVGLVPSAYAIPGLPSLLVSLDHAAKVPTPEDYLDEYSTDKTTSDGYVRKGDGGHSSRALSEAMVTLAEFEDGSRTVRRSALQLVA